MSVQRGAELPRLRSSVELGTHNLIRIMPAEGNSDTISRSSDGETLFLFTGGSFMQLTSAAIQILPMNADNAEVVRIVDEAIAFIKSFGLHTVVGPFETTVEGDYDTIMKIISEVTRISLAAGAEEIMTYVKICAKNEGNVMTIDEKTQKHN